MADDREVKVVLSADTSAYDKAMKRAAKRARKLKAALVELERVEIRIRVVRERG